MKKFYNIMYEDGDMASKSLDASGVIKFASDCSTINYHTVEDAIRFIETMCLVVNKVVPKYTAMQVHLETGIVNNYLYFDNREDAEAFVEISNKRLADYGHEHAYNWRCRPYEDE